MNSKILYVVAALVVLAIHGSISVKLRSGARTAPTNAEWGRIRSDFASVAVNASHVSEYHDSVSGRISGVLSTRQPLGVTVEALRHRLAMLGWKDYEQPIGTHAKVTRRVCRDGVVGTVSAQKDGGGLNSVFVHFKWAAGAQSSLPSRCKKGH